MLIELREDVVTTFAGRLKVERTLRVLGIPLYRSTRYI